MRNEKATERLIRHGLTRLSTDVVARDAVCLTAGCRRRKTDDGRRDALMRLSGHQATRVQVSRITGNQEAGDSIQQTEDGIVARRS